MVELSSSSKNRQGVMDAVERRTKSGIIRVNKVYDLKWTRKPFKWSYTREFKPNVRWFFHGSSDSNIQGILNTGFKPSTDGKLGAGVYATYHTDLSKSFARGGGYILSVMVYAPKTYLVDKGQSISKSEISKLRQKYHAIEVRSDGNVGVKFNKHEICVFDHLRVVPRFLIRVQ